MGKGMPYTMRRAGQIGTIPMPEGGGGYLGAANNYNYNVQITPPPASGQLRSNADFLNATKIWIHKLTTDSMDVTVKLRMVTPGMTMYVQDKNDSNCFFHYTINSLVDELGSAGAYMEFNVTETSAGSIMINGGAAILVIFSS